MPWTLHPVRAVELLLVGTALCATTASADPRPGKAIRVERIVRRFSGTPRLCSFISSELRGYCFGRAPVVDDQLEILDSHQLLGTARITHVEPIGAACRNRTTMLWVVQATPTADLVPSSDHDEAALLGVPLDPRTAHLVAVDTPPPGRALTSSVIGVDTDGDNRVDLEFMMLPCTDPTAPPNSGATQCMEVWNAPDGHALQLLRTDVIPQGCS